MPGSAVLLHTSAKNGLICALGAWRQWARISRGVRPNRGSQYAAKQYRDRLDALGIKGSMGHTGNPYDNARVESFFKTLKHEEVFAFEYQIMQNILEGLPTFLEKTYNRRSLHSSLGYVPPEEFELVYAKTEGKIPEPHLSI
jgi:transposase InsO family protein